MALHIRDPEADRMLREFASKRNLGLTEAIKVAVKDADAEPSSVTSSRSAKDAEFDARLRLAQERVSALGSSGLEVDKAFYDSLNDE